VQQVLNETDGSLKEFWKGEGADSGVAALQPLQDVNYRYSSDMSFGRDSMNGQIFAFNSTRDSLKEMPAERPEPNAWDKTKSFFGFDSAVDEADDWDEANRHNIEEYDGYRRVQQANLEGMTKEYQPFDAKNPDGDSGTSKSDSGDSIKKHSTGTDYLRDPGLGTGGGNGYGGPGSGDGGAPTGVGTPGVPGGSGPDSGGSGSGSVPKPGDSTTSSAGYTTPGNSGSGSGAGTSAHPAMPGSGSGSHHNSPGGAHAGAP